MCIPWCLILDTEGFTAAIMCDYLPYIHLQRETWEEKKKRFKTQVLKMYHGQSWVNK